MRLAILFGAAREAIILLKKNLHLGKKIANMYSYINCIQNGGLSLVRPAKQLSYLKNLHLGKKIANMYSYINYIQNGGLNHRQFEYFWENF